VSTKDEAFENLRDIRALRDRAVKAESECARLREQTESLRTILADLIYEKGLCHSTADAWCIVDMAWTKAGIER